MVFRRQSGIKRHHMINEKVQVSVEWTCRSIEGQLMDEQTGVMASMELQETSRATSKGMTRRTNISVWVVLDASSQ